MATVIVVVDTDHSDHEEALRSVSSGMKRAGYNVTDYRVSEASTERCWDTRAVLSVCEPEVDSANLY